MRTHKNSTPLRTHTRRQAGLYLKSGNKSFSVESLCLFFHTHPLFSLPLPPLSLTHTHTLLTPVSLTAFPCRTMHGAPNTLFARVLHETTRHRDRSKPLLRNRDTPVRDAFRVKCLSRFSLLPVADLMARLKPSFFLPLGFWSRTQKVECGLS